MLIRIASLVYYWMYYRKTGEEISEQLNNDYCKKSESQISVRKPLPI